MTRAKALPPDERRAAIVAAARPLVAQHGATVTTAQIAKAAGIAEGTLFRVFASKAEIVVAVILDTLDPSGVIAFVDSVREPTLPAQVRRLLDGIQSRYREAAAMFGVLQHLGDDTCAAAAPLKHNPAVHQENNARLRAALAEALAPHRDELSADVETAASLLLGFAAISSHGLVADGTLTDLDTLVDLYLHGTARKNAS